MNIKKLRDMNLHAVADEMEQLRAFKAVAEVQDGFREIVEAVAHIGVDFGYGNFALSQEHIEKARALLEAAPSHSQHSVQSPIIEFLNEAEELIDSYPFLYVEIARTRTTDWMAHLRERPNGNSIAESGQGLSAEDACEQILNNLKPDRCPSHESEQLAGLVEALEEAYGTLERAVSPADETPEAAIQSAMFVIEAALADYRKRGGAS